MALIPLGSATSTWQMVVMAASAMTWFTFHSFLVQPLSIRYFGADRIFSLSDSQRRKVYLAGTSSLFAAFITFLAAANLLFPDAAVKADRIYGSSDAVQTTFGIATGFFIWNTLVELRDFDFPIFLHHFSCIFVYLFGQYPFLPQMGCICLTWEASTPPLCFRNVLRTMGQENSALYSNVSNMFAALFIVSRIAIGVPASVLWWSDMFYLLGRGSGRLHSAAIVYFYLVANVFLNGLNIYWFVLIMKGVFRKFVAGKAERSAREEKLLAS